MNVKEEVQLAIDMGIESALEFVLLAKLNADGPEDGYWGYFNNKKVWLSRVAPGKLSKFELEYTDYQCWDKYPNIKQAYLSGMLKDNDLLLREVWDVRINKAFPRDYFTDKICRINYELKLNGENIGRLQKRLIETAGHSKSFIRQSLTACYEYEEKLNRQKNFIKSGDKSKSIVIADYKNYSLVEVISNSGLELLRSGNNKFKMCCPFHNEKTPSFFVDANKNRFNCFGCGEYGDTLDFISKYEKISVIDAAKKLSSKNT